MQKVTTFLRLTVSLVLVALPLPAVSFSPPPLSSVSASPILLGSFEVSPPRPPPSLSPPAFEVQEHERWFFPRAACTSHQSPPEKRPHPESNPTNSAPSIQLHNRIVLQVTPPTPNPAALGKTRSVFGSSKCTFWSTTHFEFSDERTKRSFQLDDFALLTLAIFRQRSHCIR